jgi:microcystin-dependent protein
MALGPTTIVGEIKAWAGNCPTMSGEQIPVTGHLLCNGTAVSRSTYDDLFAVIGTGYGVGNGTTTFNLPNFQGKFILGATSATALAAGGRGFAGGASTHGHQVDVPNHTHTVAETGGTQHTLPAHQHVVGAHTHATNHSHNFSLTSSTDSPTGALAGSASPTALRSAEGHTHSIAGATQDAGVTTSNVNADFNSDLSIVITINTDATPTNSAGAQTLTAGSGVSIIDHTPPYQILNFIIKF